MQKLKFSYIGDLTSKLQPRLDEFSHRQRIEVELIHSDWSTAWPDILNWSLHGLDQTPDVSHIGTTWGGSLVGMEYIRPFSREELQMIGGEASFLPACWQSVFGPENNKVWSLPWISYTYVLAYRRDVLAKCGIDETTAFLSIQSLNDTILKLKGRIHESPWVVPAVANHLDVLHYIASWVWGVGRDLFAPDNTQAAFLEPDALAAICSYFSLLSSATLPVNTFDKAASENVFWQGKAAIALIGADNAYHWLLGQQSNPEFHEKVGFAPIFSSPWVGGDNLVIWKSVLAQSEREHAAVALAQYLVNLESQQIFTPGKFVNLPSRKDALNAIPMQGTQLTEAVIYSLQNGRAYRPMKLWTKIEYKFANVFGQIGAEVLEGANVNSTVRKHLEPYAKWLELVLRP